MERQQIVQQHDEPIVAMFSTGDAIWYATANGIYRIDNPPPLKWYERLRKRLARILRGEG